MWFLNWLLVITNALEGTPKYAAFNFPLSLFFAFRFLNGVMAKREQEVDFQI